MHKIELGDEKILENTVVDLDEAKKNIKKTFLGNAGIIVGFFLVLVVVLMTMTDIRITTVQDFADIAVEFFSLLFVTYQMYVNTSDSGRRAGLESDLYIKAYNKYLGLKETVIQQGLQSKLPEFCATYIKRELIHTRTIIVANIGMGYEEFLEYLKLGRDEIDNEFELTKNQKKAVKKAISVTPIKLTPEMIMQGGKNSRSPLGINPKDKKMIRFASKLVSSAATSLFFGMLAFEFIETPTFTMVVYIITRLVPVVINAVSGYIFGYENIVFDTTSYLNNQSALIEEFLRSSESESCQNVVKTAKPIEI